MYFGLMVLNYRKYNTDITKIYPLITIGSLIWALKPYTHDVKRDGDCSKTRLGCIRP